MMARRRVLPLLLVLTLGGLVTGCSASDSGSSAAQTAAGGSAADSGAGTGFSAAAPEQALAGSGAANKAAVPNPAAAVTRLIRTAQITVQVPNLAVAAAKVRADATALGGIVSAENTGSATDPQPTDDTGGSSATTAPEQVPQQSVITLRVPEPRMDEALNQVTSVGKVLDRSTTSKDVTASLADLDSRVKTQTRSVNRIRDLLDNATSLKDIVLIESELSKREADLESLQAQQRVLADKADLSTITVTLRTPAAVAAVTHALDDAGFMTGLRNGFDALVATIIVVLTIVGALLPFVIIILVIGVPGYRAYRYFRPRSRPGPGPGSTPPPAPAATP
jgi:hypothetical protein